MKDSNSASEPDTGSDPTEEPPKETLVKTPPKPSPKLSKSYLDKMSNSEWFKRAHHGRSLGMEQKIEE